MIFIKNENTYTDTYTYTYKDAYDLQNFFILYILKNLSFIDVNDRK